MKKIVTFAVCSLFLFAFAVHANGSMTVPETQDQKDALPTVVESRLLDLTSSIALFQAMAPVSDIQHRTPVYFHNLKARLLRWPQEGAEVVDLDADSPLRAVGIRVGDLVTHLGGRRIADIDDPRVINSYWGEGIIVWVQQATERRFQERIFISTHQTPTNPVNQHMPPSVWISGIGQRASTPLCYVLHAPTLSLPVLRWFFHHPREEDKPEV